MVCEIDEEDLTEAAEFCSVSVLEKKQVTPCEDLGKDPLDTPEVHR